jgi:hypothetical protein
MTYGSQQAITADSLSALLQSEAVPDAASMPGVVFLRDQLRLALTERLHIIRGRYAPARDVEPHLDHIANNAHDLLPVILASTPERVDAERDSDESKLSVLSHPSDDPMVESWRRAAASATIANHDLDSGDDRPWLRRHGPHWQLIEDAATAVEALLVLDSRLEAAGALDGHRRSDRTFTLRGARTITSSIAREAAWGADAGADLVTAISANGPVHVVRGADDLVGAHQRLAAMLEPGVLEASGHRRLIDVQQARIVALSQAEENRLLARAAWSIDEPELAERFQRRAERYMSFLITSQRARPLRRTLDSTAVEHQQQELLRGTRGVTPSDLDRARLTQLDAAHHLTARALGRALRIDVNRAHSNNPVSRGMCNIVFPSTSKSRGWVRPSRLSPYGRAVQDLVCPAEAELEVVSVATAPREYLRSTLATTPSRIAWRRPSLGL